MRALSLKPQVKNKPAAFMVAAPNEQHTTFMFKVMLGVMDDLLLPCCF